MKYPLLLKFNGTTIGRGFVASVTFTGRFVGEETEHDGHTEWWLYGVNPSAIAESGERLQDANQNLRDAIKDSLDWFASQASGFVDFKARVASFVNTTNEENLSEWQEAVERVRATKATLENLPVWGAAMCATVDVLEREVTDLSPSDNSPKAELGKPASEAA
ncbi:MAG: hypothetical protein AB7L71_04835 [Vicinamibacterales bacterium]